MRWGFTLVCTLFLLHSLTAQTLEGYVIDENQLPLPGALIQLEPIGRSLISDSRGSFGPVEVPESTAVRIKVSFLGYAPVDTLINVSADRYILKLGLQRSSLELGEVTVTGKENQAGLGTSTEINRQAIAHVQPNSLRDVLQLLPGQLAINPSVNSPQQILIRQAPSTSAGSTLAQLGTSLVMDGSPISNDANLQYNVNILNSSPGSRPPFQSVSGQGTDLRQIPADQIERVEVIRGVASARHGNATSGTILVETRIGAFSPQLRVRANPNSFQVSGGVGLSVRPEKQAVSLDLDFIDSKPDPRDILNGYSRITATLGHELTGLFGAKLTWRSRLGLSSNLAVSREDEGNDPAARAWRAQDRAIRINNRLTYYSDSKWLEKVEATISLNLNRQDAFFQEFITTNVGPRPIFLKDSTGSVPFGTARYLNETTVAGRAVNYYHRLESSANWRLFGESHRVLLGTEWRYDANRGPGRTFDLTRPPRQNYSAGDRPRSFSDIPGLNQLSWYGEDRFSSRLMGKPLFWQIGVRADHYFLSGASPMSLGTHIQPRLNASWALIPQKLSLKAGYGVLSKVPSLIYLSPGPRFIDLINFNYYAPVPEERLLIVTTNKIDLPDGGVRPYKSPKAELGVDGKLFGSSFSLTAFRETVKNGPGYVREHYLARRAEFEVLEYPTGSPPILSGSPVSYDTLFLAYDRPVNNQNLVNTGLEYTVDFPEIKRINTQLNLTGAYIKTLSTSSGNVVDPGFIYRYTDSPNIPIYAGGVGVSSAQWNTSLRFIHRVPAARLVISCLVQAIWIQMDSPVGYTELPVGLIDRRGIQTSLSMDEAVLPEYDNYRREIAENQLLTERMPPLTLINLRLNKEFGEGRGFAFYVNNLTNHRPLYRSVRSDTYSQRNLSLFFGAELFYQL
ncbi:hypothetical protein J2X69_001290 [Algoriphagus sp. 4150]|uniref:TonB-dependent receptor n=1 Tax=Algoriphagus sp. 4150 TaxID=2817756 RepID=UPI00285F8FAC|nr:TonB-dependent receptor plug domain-containing protein [Algoriphagus sp. 4150]MDR7128955.1 hypothetical protein [Algoriphagus sp. 4150]